MEQVHAGGFSGARMAAAGPLETGSQPCFVGQGYKRCGYNQNAVWVFYIEARAGTAFPLAC